MSTRVDVPLDYCDMAANPPQPWPTYSPPACWSREALSARGSASCFVPKAWLPQTIEATPALVDMPSRVPEAIEFRMLHYYQAHVRPSIADAARHQAEGGFGMPSAVSSPLLCALPARTPEFERELLSGLTLAKHDASAIVMQQKLLFNRARPWQIDQSISTIIFPVPEHSSYPSGHATQSFAIALLLGELVRAAVDPHRRLVQVPWTALGLASGIAANREFAGVHYPSDTYAGLQLANRLVQNYMGDAAYRFEIFDPLVKKLNQLL